MPELPDVKVYKKYLDATSLHKTIQAVEVYDRRVLHRDKDGRCPRSHGQLKTIKVSGRTAYFCPRYQKQW
jgi:formamidopyrimidine-DNA glycosylase